MKFTMNPRAPRISLGLMLLATSVSHGAFAQTDTAKPAAPPSGAASATTTKTTPAEAAPATPAAATAPTNPTDSATAAQPTAPAADAAPATPVAQTAPATQPGTTPTNVEAKGEPEPTNPPQSLPLLVEILPGSGYPEPKVRGIVGGSLWLTMHGHQFPYMGPETSQFGTRIAISGSIWDDTSYARIKSGTPETTSSLKRWQNQGRAVLRVTPAYTTREGWFVQGQIEAVANGDQTLPTSQNVGAVDDLFVRVGKWKMFDVTVGRYQGWEVYHYGMGLDQNTLERRGAEITSQPTRPPQIYGVNYSWDRPEGGAGNYAAHVYFTDYLRAEVLGQIGTQAGSNTRSVRPIAVLDLGYLKVKAGWEYGVSSPQSETARDHTRRNGFGGAVQFVVNPYIEGGINGAIGYIDTWNVVGRPDLVNSTTTKSFGGFLNGRLYGPLIVGLGANETRMDRLEPNGVVGSSNFGENDYFTHFQSFFAVQYSVWDKLFFKFVGSQARYHFEDKVQEPGHPFTNTELGGRFRVMYLF